MVVAAFALVAVLVGLAAVWLAWPTGGLKAANFSQLRPGMTRVEVERLLGGPPGDYGRYADGDVDYGDGLVLQVFAVPGDGDAKPQTWTDDRHHFYVFFDSRDRVVAGSKQSRFQRSPKGWSFAFVTARVRAIFY